MILELLNSRSLASIIAEHLKDKIFEFRGEILTSCLLPILVKLSVQDKVVEVFVLLGFLEWENTLDNDEKDNSYREHIDLLSIVSLAFLDFRSHIGHCTSV